MVRSVGLSQDGRGQSLLRLNRERQHDWLALREGLDLDIRNRKFLLNLSVSVFTQEEWRIYLFPRLRDDSDSFTDNRVVFRVFLWLNVRYHVGGEGTYDW